MVKIAVAAGTSNVAMEVIDALCASDKHQLLLLSRKNVRFDESRPCVSWIQTDYQDKANLVKILRGVHTILSFVVTQLDPGSITQRNLIDAAVIAGVKRFAPSEWATSTMDHLPWYAGKHEIRAYLEEINRHQKVLEYCLFLPGLFTNYFTHPHPSAKHFKSFETHIDFDNRRALVLDGSGDHRMTLTTVQDFAAVVARAVEYEGEWPVVGGIKGTEISVGQLLALGERIRGRPLAIERLAAEDLKVGVVKSSWLPKPEHSGIPPEHANALLSKLVAGMLLATSAGALNVSDEWNQLLPDFRFMQAEDFLAGVWTGRP